MRVVFALGAVAASAASVKVTPVQKVIQMMEDMVAAGKKEKHAEAVRFSAFEQWCGDVSAEKKHSIEEASMAIEQSEATIAKAEKVEEAKLSVDDMLDIKAQQELADLNGTLMQAFLSHDDIQDEIDAAISVCLEEIKSLQAAGDDDEVKAVRTALAEMLWSGDDPFPGVGDQMSAEDQELFSSALQEANHLLMQHMAQSAKRIEEIYDFTVTAEDQALTEQSGKLLQELVPLREAYESYVEQLQENQPK
jgi:hypothetical protein